MRLSFPDVAWTVQHDVLATAAGRTHNQITRDLARELVKVDPEEAAARHARAVRGQHVTHPRALADGMASMYVVAGAEDAVPFDLLLTNAARAARADGDPRSVDVLRAEALFALAAGALHTGTAGPPAGHCTCPRHDPTDHLTPGGADADADSDGDGDRGDNGSADREGGPPDDTTGARTGSDGAAASGSAADGDVAGATSGPEGVASGGSGPDRAAGTAGAAEAGATPAGSRADADPSAADPPGGGHAGADGRPPDADPPDADPPGAGPPAATAGAGAGGGGAPAARLPGGGSPPAAGEAMLPPIHLLMRQRRGMRLGDPGIFRTEVRVSVPIDQLLPPADASPGAAPTGPAGAAAATAGAPAGTGADTGAAGAGAAAG
ncbi:DUF222 domain-containing protein, partial [Georgenia ruanii]|uniref:DUF222 domain-containing protein n=1 Tax=Georgenia ruanii TaxID=348442 RepID=UPI0038600B7B